MGFVWFHAEAEAVVCVGSSRGIGTDGTVGEERQAPEEVRAVQQLVRGVKRDLRPTVSGTFEGSGAVGYPLAGGLRNVDGPVDSDCLVGIDVGFPKRVDQIPPPRLGNLSVPNGATSRDDAYVVYYCLPLTPGPGGPPDSAGDKRIPGCEYHIAGLELYDLVLNAQILHCSVYSTTLLVHLSSPDHYMLWFGFRKVQILAGKG